MHECSNVRIRELLPDLPHGGLDAGARAEVEAHLAACADCRAELALLRQVIAAAPVPRLDTAKIVAALASRRSARGRAVRGRWSVRSPMLQAAAAVLLVVGGALFVAGRGARSARTPSSAPVASIVTEPRTESAVAALPAELAVGESLQDLSEGDLKALADEMGSLEAVTSSETEAVPPAVDRGGA